jgi:NitT/TauT family transport system substrate-binding protein
MSLLRLTLACIAIAAAALGAHSLAAQTTAPNAAQPPPTTAGPAPLRLTLDSRLGGAEAAFALALDRGYFRAEGLDVTIDDATQQLEPINRVANASHDLGFADINAMMRYRDQHPTAPIKAVFMVYSTPPFAVVARRSRGITEPRQLEGKKIGASPAGRTFAQWPLFAKLNGIDVARVKIEMVGLPVAAPMLAAGQIDAALGASFRLYVDLKDRGVLVDDIELMQMASYGLKLYGNAMVVNSKFAADNPAAVAGFLRAVLRGMKETIRRPGDAVDAVLKRDDAARREVELERLRMVIRDNIVTPEVRKIGLGAIERARLEESIEQLALVNTFKTKPKVEDVFDPAFLPPAADRKIN